MTILCFCVSCYHWLLYCMRVCIVRCLSFNVQGLFFLTFVRLWQRWGFVCVCWLPNGADVFMTFRL
jgi:hypothetical protein